MKKTTKKNTTSLNEILDSKYGKRGSKKREERGFEAFRVGEMLQEIRRKKGMTQQELAEKCGTTKNYISRIENDASDIRLSTLMRIFSEGFGMILRINAIN